MPKAVFVSKAHRLSISLGTDDHLVDRNGQSLIKQVDRELALFRNGTYFETDQKRAEDLVKHKKFGSFFTLIVKGHNISDKATGLKFVRALFSDERKSMEEAEVNESSIDEILEDINKDEEVAVAPKVLVDSDIETFNEAREHLVSLGAQSKHIKSKTDLKVVGETFGVNFPNIN